MCWVVGVLLGCINVVPTTVRESVTPDFKENKLADTGSRLFSKAFFLRRVVVEFLSAEREGLFVVVVVVVYLTLTDRYDSSRGHKIH